MKNYAIFTLLFVLGCHNSSSGQNGNPQVATQNDPSLIVSDTTLGCQKTFGAPTKETSYEDMIDGKPGTYKLISSTAYIESQPFSDKNSNLVLQNYNVVTAGIGLNSDQSVSCYDYSRPDAVDLKFKYFLPYSINRADGTILDGAEFSLESTATKSDGTLSVSNTPDLISCSPKWPDLKSMSIAKSPRQFRTMQFSRITPDEVHILITEKFFTEKNNKGIKIILGVYRFSSI